jgi:hypothetical protein
LIEYEKYYQVKTPHFTLPFLSLNKGFEPACLHFAQNK